MLNVINKKTANGLFMCSYQCIYATNKKFQTVSWGQHGQIKVKCVKGKEVDLYSAFTVVSHTQDTQVRITQCYLQITPYLPLPRKHSPDGASPDRGCGHLIAAYYLIPVDLCRITRI